MRVAPAQTLGYAKRPPSHGGGPPTGPMPSRSGRRKKKRKLGDVITALAVEQTRVNAGGQIIRVFGETGEWEAGEMAMAWARGPASNPATGWHVFRVICIEDGSITKACWSSGARLKSSMRRGVNEGIIPVLRGALRHEEEDDGQFNGLTTGSPCCSTDTKLQYAHATDWVNRMYARPRPVPTTIRSGWVDPVKDRLLVENAYWDPVLVSPLALVDSASAGGDLLDLASCVTPVLDPTKMRTLVDRVVSLTGPIARHGSLHSDHTKEMLIAGLTTVRTRNDVSRAVFHMLCDTAHSRGGWQSLTYDLVTAVCQPLGMVKQRVTWIMTVAKTCRHVLSEICCGQDAIDKMVAEIGGVGEKLACVIESYLTRARPCIVVDTRVLATLNHLGVTRTTGGRAASRKQFPEEGWSVWCSNAADKLSRDLRAPAAYVSADWSRYKIEEMVELAFQFSVALNRLGGKKCSCHLSAINVKDYAKLYDV